MYEKLILRPNALQEIGHVVWNILQNIKKKEERKKIYADKKKIHKEFNIGEHVYIREKPRKFNWRIGTCTKLAPQFHWAFEILDKIVSVAYDLAFPNHIKVHNFFHLSFLKTMSMIILMEVIGIWYGWNSKDISFQIHFKYYIINRSYSEIESSIRLRCNEGSLHLRMLVGRERM